MCKTEREQNLATPYTKILTSLRHLGVGQILLSPPKMSVPVRLWPQPAPGQIQVYLLFIKALFDHSHLCCRLLNIILTSGMCVLFIRRKKKGQSFYERRSCCHALSFKIL